MSDVPARSPRDGGTALLLAAACPVLLLAALLDPTIAREAAAEPRALLRLGTEVSQAGLSGYMLALATAVALTAAAAARRRVAAIGGLSPAALAERASFFVVAVAGSGIVCQILKHLLARARPRFFQSLGPYHFDLFSVRSGFDSFPSGHSTTVFAAAAVFGLLHPRGRPVYLALALLIGLARILARAHYPSDVVAGAALGTVVTLWLARAFARRDIVFSVAMLPRLALRQASRNPDQMWKVAS